MKPWFRNHESRPFKWLRFKSWVLSRTTCGTAVRFFSWVASFVLQQFSVRVKGFSTLVTCERLVCGMSPLVLFEITQIIKSWVSIDNMDQRSSKTGDSKTQWFENVQKAKQMIEDCLKKIVYAQKGHLPRPHMSHRCGLSPVWTTLWRWTSPDAVKLQNTDTIPYGELWEAVMFSNVSGAALTFYHTTHRCMVSLLSVVASVSVNCRPKEEIQSNPTTQTAVTSRDIAWWYTCENFFPQILHWKGFSPATRKRFV